MRFSEIPPTGRKLLLEQCEQKKMQLIKVFLRWYKNKDVVPTSEEMQNLVEFSHNKGIDMLKLRCTLPNRGNNYLHGSNFA